jgi:hypothetical protein
VADELADAQENLKWADENISKLDAAFRAFFNTKPYRLVTEVDQKIGEVREKVIPDSIPWQFKFMARDIVHTLRIPLDYLACRLAVANKQSTDGVYYPIRKSKTAFDSTGTQGNIVKQFGADAVAWIATQQPYLGGDDLVWAVHEIDRVDKHIELQALNAGSGLSGGLIMGGTFIGGVHRTMIIGPREPDPADGSIVLLSYDIRNANSVKNKGTPHLFVAFRDVGPIKGKSVPQFLREAHTRVSAIIADAESTFFS